MAKTVPTWGYSKEGPKLFQLPAGAALPDGWHDSPAKVPGGMQSEGKARVQPSAVEQGLAETKRLLEEERARSVKLAARVAELEEQLSGEPYDAATDVPVPRPEGETSSTASMQSTTREVVGSALDRLRQRAEGLGVKVDNRWGADRLQREIEAAEKGKPSE